MNCVPKILSIENPESESLHHSFWQGEGEGHLGHRSFIKAQLMKEDACHMILRLRLSLQLLVLAVAALYALPHSGALADAGSGSDSDLIRADIDAASFSAERLHEDTEFS
jgi:hypothetical protein